MQENYNKNDFVPKQLHLKYDMDKDNAPKK